MGGTCMCLFPGLVFGFADLQPVFHGADVTRHLGTFRADGVGDAVESNGSPSGWKTVRFPQAGLYAFSVVGIDVQNPTNLKWDMQEYGLYLKEIY